jgi:ribosomal protein L29
METVAKPKELEEKSTEELIRILQEKKKKLLLLQYASKELAE